MIIYSHDEMADIVGMPSKCFEDTYPDKSKEMKRTLLEYIKTIQAAHAGAGAGAGVISGQAGLTIQLDPDRFPIAAHPLSWSKVSKDIVEPLYRTYITQHYRKRLHSMPNAGIDGPTGLACRDQDRQAPFQRIAAKPSDFIDPKHLPNGITISDPRSMKLESIVKFFQHVAAREATHGIQQAFRFKAVLSSRKEGRLRDARYNDFGAELEAVLPPPQRKRRPKA
jgi:hypothetical protein